MRAADTAESLGECANLIKYGGVDIVAAPGLWGITEAMKVAALAAANHVGFEPHDFYFYGGAATLHVALAVSHPCFYELNYPEGVFDTQLYPGVYLTPPAIDAEGNVLAPTRPGLGFAVDMKEAEKVTVERR